MKNEVNQDALSAFDVSMDMSRYALNTSDGEEKGHTEELVVTSVNRLVDSVDKTGKVDGDGNTQSDGRSPVDTTFVSIDTLVLVKHRNVELPLSDKEVISDLSCQLDSPNEPATKAYHDREQWS